MADLPDQAEAQLRKVERAQQFHDEIVRQHRRRFDAFLGHLDRASTPAQWQSQLHPPYLDHIVETHVASLVDDALTFKVTPKPRLYSGVEYERLLLGAKAHEDLHRQQLANDRFHEQQRPITLIAAVNGWSIAKSFWKNEIAPRTRLVLENAAPDTLAGMVSIPRLVERTRSETVFDGPVTEAVDPRDFYWEEGAPSLDKSGWCAHAVWMLPEDIEALAKAGKYDRDAVNRLHQPNDVPPETDVERDREKRGRKKGRIEVLEIWDRTTMTVTTIGARTVVLRGPAKWPFWHRQYPFTVFSTQPFPFSVQGKSLVDKLIHLQEAAWDLMNQRHDNLKFLNNAIAMIRADIDDPDLPYEPQAQWFLEDPASVQMWHPDPTAAQISLPAEEILKQTMQNLAGGQPFTSTSEANTIGADTATEAALVSNIGQSMERRFKTELYYGYQRVGQQRTELNQQFIREPVYAQIVKDPSVPPAEILPELLQGDFLFDITPMSESLMRSERRAERQGLFQTFVQAAPVLLSTGVNVNFKALAEDLLKDGFDIQDTDRYFPPTPPPQQPMAPGGQPPQQGTPSLTPGNQGVTAPQATQANTSPSHQASLSPETFLQRMGAMHGGVANH